MKKFRAKSFFEVHFSLTNGMLGILAERNLLFARMGGIFITAGH
jgi:hypothetical protein